MKRVAALFLLPLLGACATTRAQKTAEEDGGVPVAWPPGVYAVSGRAEIPGSSETPPQSRAFLGTLMVAAGGDVQLVGCGANAGTGSSSRSFECGNETWSFSTDGEIIRGRVSTTAMYYVDSNRTECILWNLDDQGRRTSCARWQKEPPRLRRGRISAELHVTLKN